MNIGSLVMFVSTLIFSFMTVLVKMVSKRIPAAEITLARFLFGLGAIYLLSKTGLASIRAHNVKILILRGIFGGISAVMFYAAISSTSLAKATLLAYTYPFFATIFSSAYLKEKIRLDTAGMLVICTLGIVLVVGIKFEKIILGDLWGVLSGLFGGAAITALRKLRQSESSWTIVFYFCVVGCVVVAFPVALNPVIPDKVAFLLLFATGATAMVGQLAMSYAFRFCTAAHGSIISMATVVFSSILGYLLFAERLNLSSIVGGILLLGSAVYLAIMENMGLRNREMPLTS